ncbi:MAG: O-antigen ligase family protein [Sphingomonas adhaesiva]|uniref:O-antigen ligase family protein n=1 Tax=Sphingomonas adhaesiva TaxID=28212 RepID=UPI002FF9A057
MSVAEGGVSYQDIAKFILPGFAMLVLQFTVQLGPLAPLLFVMTSFAAAYVYREEISKYFVFLLPIMAAGLFPVVSTLWSQAPSTTLKLSAEVVLTMLVGIGIGVSDRRSETIVSLAAAFAIFLFVSFIFGGSVAWGATAGSTAFAGLNGGKSAMADSASLALIGGLAAVFVIPKRGNGVFLAGAFLLTIVVATYILVQARSSGAIVSATSCVALFLTLMIYRLSSNLSRVIAVLSVLIAVSILIFLFVTFKDEIATTVLAALGKDPTLTGRVYLWARAEPIMAQNPLLGVGYGSFWRVGNADAEGLWRYAGITSQKGFNFHNAMVEMRINIGWIGYGLIAAVTVMFTLSLLGYMVLVPEIEAMFWLVIGILYLSRVQIEAVGLAPFNHVTVLLTAMLSFSAAAVARARHAAADTVPARRTRRTSARRAAVY